MYLFAAFDGGLFGAAIGGQPSLIFTGFMVLLGTAMGFLGGDYDFLENVAFGPVFGPHIAFAGGVMAMAHAAGRSQADSGRDIASPMAGLGDPVRLLIGDLFGVGGYVVQFGTASLLTTDRGLALTDSVALTVFISGIVARVASGRTGPFGTLGAEAEGRVRKGSGFGHNVRVTDNPVRTSIFSRAKRDPASFRETALFNRHDDTKDA